MKCRNCGKPLPPDSDICEYCGAKAAASRGDLPRATRRFVEDGETGGKRRPGAGRVLAVLGAAALVICIVVIGLVLLKTPRETVTVIPTGTGDASLDSRPEPDTTAEPVRTEPASTETEAVTTEAPATEAPPETEDPIPAPTPDDVEGPADVTAPAYKSGTVYIADNAGYGGYYFNKTTSGRYCEISSNLARALEGKATVYSMICPLSTGILLSDQVRESTGFSDEQKAIRWMCDHMDPLVVNVPLYGALKSRNDEYIYFRTDHHWTALGAFYAYREFCAQKRMVPHELSDFETYEFPNYVGSFYNYSNRNAALKQEPDTVTAYIPNGTNTMDCYINMGNGSYQRYDWDIVKDVSSYDRGSYYLTFVAGDQPYNYAHNETITDGSSVLIVKDSYGNAFIPYLIDHYEYIYWIDFRNYKKWCGWAGYSDPSISNLVERKGIQDVILCQNISIAGSSSALDVMESIYK